MSEPDLPRCRGLPSRIDDGAAVLCQSCWKENCGSILSHREVGISFAEIRLCSRTTSSSAGQRADVILNRTKLILGSITVDNDSL